MRKLVLLFIVVCAVGAACKIHKNVIAYEFPAAMSETVRIEYGKQCEKGRVLYEINCAKCHATTVGRRKVIPDFTPAQLVGYELRVTNARHESSLTDESVNTEELGLIMTFLTYKKKNK